MCRFANYSYEPVSLLAVHLLRAMAGNWLPKAMKFGGAEWEWAPIRDAGHPECSVEGWRVWVCAASDISVPSVLSKGSVTNDQGLQLFSRVGGVDK